MTYYIFGKDISRKFYPLSNDEPYQIPTQTPTIYIFESQPNLEDARDGGGAVATISSWSQNASSPYDCTYTISAIDDPTPESLIPQRTYYEAINYIAQTSEQIQTVVRSFEIERASGSSAVVGVTYTDLVEVYPAITAYASANQLGSIIGIATDEIELKLKGKGVRWSDIQNVNELKRAVAYRSIQLLSESQFSESNDKFVTRREIYKEKFEESMADTVLYVDIDKDGVPDQIKTGKPGYVISSR
jgi:hypothetical protein